MVSIRTVSGAARSTSGRNRAYRFGAPDGKYGALYVGVDPYVAFIESFQIAGIRPVITESKLN